MILALSGPKKKLSIVNDLKINKQQISQSLVDLQDRGIIFTDLKNKNEFVALPFEKALELLIKTEKVKTQILQETKKTLLSDRKYTNFWLAKLQFQKVKKELKSYPESPRLIIE